MSRQICILAHGVDTDPVGRSWNDEVEVAYQPLASTFGIELVSHKYGYVPGWQAWFSAFVRSGVVDREEQYYMGKSGEYEGLFENIGPTDKVHYVGHSLGGYIGTALLKRGLRFRNMILMWSWSVEHFNWYNVDSNFHKIRVLWSPNDEKVTTSQVADKEDPELATGLMGRVGSQISHPRVESIEFPDWKHDTFSSNATDRHSFWKDNFLWLASS